MFRRWRFVLLVALTIAAATATADDYDYYDDDDGFGEMQYGDYGDDDREKRGEGVDEDSDPVTEEASNFDLGWESDGFEETEHPEEPTPAAVYLEPCSPPGSCVDADDCGEENKVLDASGCDEGQVCCVQKEVTDQSSDDLSEKGDDDEESQGDEEFSKRSYEAPYYEGGPYGDDYRGYAPYSVNYSGPADASGALDYGAQYLGHRDDLEKVLGSKDLYVKPYTSPGLYNEYLNADDLALLTERKSFIIFQAIRYLQYKIKDKESLGYVVKDLDGNYNKKYEDQKKGNVAYPAARSYTAPDLTYAYNDTYSKNGAPVGDYAKSSSGGCRPGKYRTYDGYCNNPNYPNWGRAFTVLNRLLAPRYADGVSAPRRGYNGYPLPNPRLISSYMVHDQSRPIYYNSLMVMQWGQFIVHDISFTPVYKARGTYGILCCAREIYTNPSLLHPECFPILVPKDDYFYSKQPGYTGCMEFVRSLAGTSYSGKREQLNQASSYIDGSLIYGSTEEHARSLRSYKHGQLTTVKKYGHHYIPITRHQCQHDPSECYRVKTGDSRANMHPWLTALHHVFVRYHNYVAYHLYRVNPDWDDEYLYQEARKVLGASLQYITYHEYLPALLGYDYLKRYGLVLKYYGYSYDYDAKVDASALNEFVTAAFRMGHSTIYGLIEWRSQEYGNGKFGPLRNHYFQAYETSEPGVMDKYILSTMTQWQETIDTYVTREVTNYLFKTKNTSYGFDLISLNIQRGRDHGLPGYNEYRKYCGLNKAYSFEDLYPSINKDVIDKLKYLYKTVDDIDLYIGGIAENPYRYSLLGPTFSCIVASQFQRLKKGDYYWHELGGQPWSFTLDQLTEIRKINLGWVFCHFADKIRYVQRWVFKTPGPKNPYFRCDDPKAFPVIDWGKWKAGGYNNASYGQANYSLPSYSPMASQGKYSYGGYGGYPPSGYGGYSNYSHDGYGGYPPSGYGGYSNYSYGGYGGYPPSGNGGYPPSGYGGYSNYSQDGYSGYPPLSKGGYSEYAQGRSFANYLKSTIYNSTRPQYAKSSYDGFNKFSYNASGNGDYGDYSGNGYGGYSGNGYGGYPGNGYGGYPMNTSYSGYSGNGYGGYSGNGYGGYPGNGYGGYPGNGYGGYPMNTSYSGYSGNGYGGYPVNTSYSTEYHSSNYSDDDGQAYERYPRGEGYGGRPPGYSSPYISSTFQGKPPYGPSSSGNGYGPNKNNSYTSSASNYTSHGSGSRYSSSGGSYGYGAQGRSFTAMDYTPASGAGGSYGGAPAYGTGSSYGAAPGYPAGSSYGGAPAYPAGSSYGGAPAYPAGSSYGGAPAYGAGSSYGGAPAYGAGSSYGGAPAYGMGDSYGSAPAYGGYGADYYGSKDYGGYDTSLYGSGYGKGGYGEAYDSSDYSNRYAGTEYDKGGDYGGKAHDYGASYAGADYDASHGYGGKAHDRGDYYGSKAYDHGDRYDASAYGAGTAYNDTAYDAAARYADRAYGKGYGTNDSAYSAAGLYDKDAYAKAAAQDYYTHGASDRYHDVGYGQADRYKTGARDYGAQYGGQAYDTGKAYGSSDYDAASHYDAASKAKADAYDAGQAQKYGSLYGSAGATGDKYYTASADSGDKAHGQIEYTDTGYSTSSYGSDASYGSSSYGTNKTYGGGGSAHNVSLTGDYDKSSYDTGKAYGKDKYDATSAYGAGYYDQSKYHGGARYDADAYAKAGAHDYGKAQYGADYDSAAKYGGTAYDTSRDYDAARASYGTETDAARYADTKAYGAAKYDAGLKEGAKYYDQGKAHGAAGYDYGSRTDADAYDRGRGHGEAQYGYGAKAAASAYDTARASDAARYDAASDYYGAGAAKAKQYSGDVYDARKDYGGQYHDKAKSYDADAYGRKKTYDKTGYGAYGQDYGAGAHGQQYGSAYGQQYGGGYRAPPGGYYSDAPYADDASAAVVESPTEPPKGRSYQKYTVAGTEYYVSKEIHPTDAPGAPVNGEKPYERSFPIGKGAEDAFLAGKDYAGASYDSAKALAAHQFVNKTKYEESMQSKSKKFESEVYSSQNDTKVHAAGDKGTLSEALAKASSAMENEMVDLEAQRRSTTTTAAPSPQWTGQAHRPPPNVRPNGQRLPYRRPA